MQRVSMLKTTMGGDVFDDGATAEEFFCKLWHL